VAFGSNNFEERSAQHWKQEREGEGTFSPTFSPFFRSLFLCKGHEKTERYALTHLTRSQALSSDSSSSLLPTESSIGLFFSGALTKQGHFRENWKLRYFVLQGEFLYYYENHLVDSKQIVFSVFPFCFFFFLFFLSLFFFHTHILFVGCRTYWGNTFR
jgi:hypothetical protein